MAEYRQVEPVLGPEAFEERGRNAQLTQAALVLAAGSAVGGRADLMPAASELGLPELGPLELSEKVSVAEAVAPLEITLTDHVERLDLRIADSESAPVVRGLVDHPGPVLAATLVEANLHSPHPVVRASAAVAALDTTGPRDDIVARLAEESRSRDPLTRDIARIGLARVEPQHEALRYLAGKRSSLTGNPRPSHTAVVTHGTFAAKTTWWKKGGNFYEYLSDLVPSLFMYDPSFQWSGLYSHEARDLDADNLLAWVPDQGMYAPDFFAHSHGGTVANLATRKGLRLNRLVMLGWPVHGEWFPDFKKVTRVIDVRVKWDLVIMADRGGQVYVPPSAYKSKVSSHVNGWFDHNDPRDGAYWDQHDLPSKL